MSTCLIVLLCFLVKGDSHPLILNATEPGGIVMKIAKSSRVAKARLTHHPRRLALWCGMFVFLFLLTGCAGSRSSAQVSGPGCSEPFYGTYGMRFSAGAVVHEGTLYMHGCTGSLYVSYYSVARKRTERVKQTIRVRSSSEGIVLLGYRPVYAGSNRPHPTYAADNFLIQVDQRGGLSAINCDDAGQCSPVNFFRKS